MKDYQFLNIPTPCFMGNTIFKKQFYENTNLSTADKKLFTNPIEKITLVACLQTESIHIPTYKDKERNYLEIQIVEVSLKEDYRLQRIAELVMRAIPYPMLLIFTWSGKKQFCVAHQKESLNDASKNTLEELITTGWVEADSPLFTKLDLKQMRFTNFYTLYCDIVDTISLHKVADFIPQNTTLSGETARLLSRQLEKLEEEILSLKSQLKKETQFNRKAELNIKIRELKETQARLRGGHTE